VPEVPILQKPKLNVEEYFRASFFDPRLEINKERHLDDFFKEKYKRVNNYLQKAESKTP
jgi:hypothetical protein